MRAKNSEGKHKIRGYIKLIIVGCAIYEKFGSAMDCTSVALSKTAPQRMNVV